VAVVVMASAVAAAEWGEEVVTAEGIARTRILIERRNSPLACEEELRLRFF
jgi:hypothetical protein